MMTTDIVEFLRSGLVGADVALFLNRVLLGAFFVLARFRWIFDPSRPEHWLNQARHVHLSEKLHTCGFGDHPRLAAFVALAEISAGLALVLGFLTSLAGAGLILLLLAAMSCTTKEKTMRQQPVDDVQVVEDVLWTVEPIYLTLALVAFLCGGGAYSLDAVLFAH
jgi:uncharacterized membrane protein YphA (DoxX/SURF4 family)